MPKKKYYTEVELAKLAKEMRLKAGIKKAHLARELGVIRPTMQHAEEMPTASLTKLRCRIIEHCSSFKVVGPVFLLTRK